MGARMSFFEPSEELITEKCSAYVIARDNVSLGNQFTMSDLDDSKKMELHPTTLELAVICQLVYKYRNWRKAKNPLAFLPYAIEECDLKNKIKKKEDLEKIQEFQFMYCGHDEKTGLNAICLYRDKSAYTRHQQIVVAFEGTKDVTQMEADLKGIAQNKFIPLINSAVTFTLGFLDDFLAKIKDKSKIHLTITGHSLGGWLAQLATFAVQNLQIDKYNSFKVKSYSECEVYPHCEVFDSPGAYQILVGLCHYSIKNDKNNKIRAELAIPLLDVSTFVIKPNLVNSINDCVGYMYALCRPEKYSNTLLGSVIETKHFHPINLLIEFIQKTGNDVKNYQVTKWPLAIFQGFNTVTGATFETMILRGINFVREVLYFLWDLFWSSPANEIYTFRPEEVYLNGTILIGTIHKRERTLIKYLETMISWKKICPQFFPKNVPLHMKMLASDFDYITENYDSVKFPNRNTYLVFRNAALLSSELRKELENHKGFKTAYYLSATANYIRFLQSEYIPSLKVFVQEESSVRGTPILYFSNETNAELFLLNIANRMKPENNVMKKENTLILSYNDFTRWNYEFDQKFQNIFVRCFDLDGVIATSNLLDKANDLQGRAQFIMISSDPEQCQTNMVLQAEREELLNHTFNFQGIFRNPNENWLDFEERELPVLLDFIQNFGTGDREDTTNLLKKNPNYIVNIGEKVPSIYSDSGLYTEPIHSFVSSIDCLSDRVATSREYKYKSVEDSINFFTRGLPASHLFYYTRDRSIKIRLREQLKQRTNCSFMDYSSRITDDFQLNCEYISKISNNSQIANLLEVRRTDKEFIVQWIRHFNPNFKVKRIIKSPLLDLRCINFRDVSLSINSVAVASTYEGMGCRSYVASEKNNEKFLSDPMQSYDSIEIKTSIGYSCQVILQKGREKVSETKLSDHGELIDESQFGLTSDILILADQPGMGKTVSMLALASNLMNTGKYWVLFKELKLLTFDGFDPNDVQTFLRSSFINETDQLSSIAFDFLFNSERSEKLAFIFDGFDELPSKWQPLMLNVLTFLRKMKKCKIIVSSRLHNAEEVQVVLGVLPHNFEPLANFKEILQTSWKGLVKLNSHNQEQRFNIFCDNLSKSTERVIDESIDVLGVPLHLKMISDVYLETLVKFVNEADGNQESKLNTILLPNGYTLAVLYGKYIKRKYFIYYHQKLLRKKDDSKEVETILEIATESFAAKAINVDPEVFKKLCWDIFRFKLPINEKLSKKLYAIGIVKPSLQPELTFIHRSIAEFYIAKFMYFVLKTILLSSDIDNSDSELQRLLMEAMKQLFSRRQVVIRNFFQNFIVTDEEIVSKIEKFELKCLIPINLSGEVSEIPIFTYNNFFVANLDVRHDFNQTLNFVSFLIQIIHVSDMGAIQLIKMLRTTFLSLLLPNSATLKIATTVWKTLKDKTNAKWIDVPFLCYSHNVTYSLQSVPAVVDPILDAFRKQNLNWDELVSSYMDKLLWDSGDDLHNLPRLHWEGLEKAETQYKTILNISDDQSELIHKHFEQLQMTKNNNKIFMDPRY